MNCSFIVTALFVFLSNDLQWLLVNTLFVFNTVYKMPAEDELLKRLSTLENLIQQPMSEIHVDGLLVCEMFIVV